MNTETALAYLEAFIAGGEELGTVSEEEALAALAALGVLRREWVAIAEIKSQPPGHYQLRGHMGWALAEIILEQGVYVNGDRCSLGSIARGYDEFRLITRADDFTPPSRRYKLGESEYSLQEINDVLMAAGLAATKERE